MPELNQEYNNILKGLDDKKKRLYIVMRDDCIDMPEMLNSTAFSTILAGRTAWQCLENMVRS
ncbi:MAG: hypothetical protein K2X81_21225, partial [Candidatus Obscuribacterales bacterium]|nr:hypothetical protein [Candidatus Obscuribacterales bacterium]